MTKPVAPKRRRAARAVLSPVELLKAAYAAFWLCRATAEQQRLVLDDLAAFCGWDRDPFQNGKANLQDYLLGQHRVFLRIQSMAGVRSPLGREVGPIEEPAEDLRKGQLRIAGEN